MPARPEYASAGLAAVLVPQANATVEAEMQVLLPPGCGAITARLISASQDSRTRLVEYIERIDAALDTFDLARPGVALFACTGSSYLVSREKEESLFSNIQARRGYAIVSAAQAVAEALDALGATRIALVSPYPAWLTEACVAFWRMKGREVVLVHVLEGDRTDTRNIYALGSRDATRVLEKNDFGNAQAVLVSGTGMPTLGAIAAGAVSLPVLSSNLCLAWVAAKRLGAGPTELAKWIGKDAWWRTALRARYPAVVQN